MKTVSFLLTLCATFPVAAAAMPPEAEAVFAGAGVKLADADLYRIAELHNFWAQKGEKIWPGADISSVPVQIVFPEKLDVLIGHPAPPAGCEPAAVRLPGLNRTFCSRPDRTFLYGFATGKENEVPTVSLNTMDALDDYVSAQLEKRSPGSGKYRRPYMEYLGSMAHEMLHAYQYSEREFLPEDEKSAGKPKLNKLDYPYQDEESCLLLGLEGRLLADLLYEKDPARVRELWQDFVTARARRRARLKPDLVSIEQYMELTEGTARYAGETAQRGDNSGVRPLPQTAADPRFRGYSSSDTVREGLKERLLTLENPYMSRGMSYAYETGMALALGLDTAVPGWKKGLFRKVSGFKSGLDGLLTSALKEPGDGARRLEKLYERYDAPRMRSAIRKILDIDLADGKAKLEAFRAAPGRRYRLVFPGVKPEDLLVYYPGVVAEYGNLRLLLRGATQVSFDLSEDENRDIKFAAVVPVLYDREAGALEFAVASSSGPAVTAARTESAGGITAYSGGVKYDNGVFSWSGARLEVSEKDGVTTLAFLE